MPKPISNKEEKTTSPKPKSATTTTTNELTKLKNKLLEIGKLINDSIGDREAIIILIPAIMEPLTVAESIEIIKV